MRKNRKVSRPLRIAVTVLLVLLCVLAVALAIYSVAYDVKKQSSSHVSASVSRAVPIPPSSADVIPYSADVRWGEGNYGQLVFEDFAISLLTFTNLATTGSAVSQPVHTTNYFSFNIGQNSQVFGSEYYMFGVSSPETSLYLYGGTITSGTPSGNFGCDLTSSYCGLQTYSAGSNLSWSSSGSYTPMSMSRASLKFGTTYMISMCSPYNIRTGTVNSFVDFVFSRLAVFCLKPFDSSTIGYFRFLPVLEGERTPSDVGIVPTYDPAFSSKILYYREDSTDVSGLVNSQYYYVPTKLVFFDTDDSPVLSFYYFSAANALVRSDGTGRVFYQSCIGQTRYNSVIYSTAGDSQGAYTRGFDAGYTQGYGYGLTVGETNGFDHGQKVGYDTGFSVGYSSGVENANTYSFVGLITAIVDAPIKAFQSMFNFEILGFNMSAFLLSLLTLSIALKLISLITGNS